MAGVVEVQVELVAGKGDEPSVYLLLEYDTAPSLQELGTAPCSRAWVETGHGCTPVRDGNAVLALLRTGDAHAAARLVLQGLEERGDGK